MKKLVSLMEEKADKICPLAAGYARRLFHLYFPELSLNYLEKFCRTVLARIIRETKTHEKDPTYSGPELYHNIVGKLTRISMPSGCPDAGDRIEPLFLLPVLKGLHHSVRDTAGDLPAGTPPLNLNLLDSFFDRLEMTLWVRVCGTAAGISEIPAAEQLYEQQLHDQKHFFLNLIENSSMPTFVLDSSHRVIIWNRACEHLTGYTAEEMLNTESHWQGFYLNPRPCLADIVIDGNPDSLTEYYINYGISEVHTNGLWAEGWFKNRRGREGYIVFNAAPIYNDSGELIAAIETLRDITERKKAQEALELKNRQISEELETAARLQRNLLPAHDISIPGLEIAWVFEPSTYIAGDMFGIFRLDEENTGFYILDVMGHGVSAALKAVTISYLLKPSSWPGVLRDSRSDRNITPAETLNNINQHFSMLDTGLIFVTIFYGILNLKSLEFTYARAGHNPPFLLRHDREIEELSKGEPALGFTDKTVYHNYQVSLYPGDRVFFYTDGILGTPAQKNSGKKQLLRLLADNSEKDLKEILTLAKNNARNSTLKGGHDDDITLLAFGISS
ncbi:SpoIIE family protein phosphatase [Thermincola potens]|uniref:Putative PAS/PAC sensor protein n=1 Tax=Thermincola potens (strain JR) TaxID=635013 RepID=D5XB77_THEPJ|nr:SpoIIE family protein phosphatase [Thermincola potens]ADG81397.1 putative PAS/PAC sensor protein [Thermincola potens JR]